MKNYQTTPEIRLMELSSLDTDRPKLLRKKPESLPKINLSKLEGFTQ